MKAFVGVITMCSVALAAAADTVQLERARGDHPYRDDAFDLILGKFQQLQANGNLDGPVAMPCADVSHKFEWLLTKGQITLKNSDISELSAIELLDETAVLTHTHDGPVTTIKLVINFNIQKLKVKSDYDATYGLWKGDGGVENTYKGVSGVMVVYSMYEFPCQCDARVEYEIISAESVTTKFTGNKWSDWIVNILLAIFNDSICDRLFGCVKEVLENFMSRLNVVECSS